MKPITYEDLYEFRFVSDIKLSPDGAYGVFTVTQADKDKNGYASCLWLLDTAEKAVRPLTEGVDEKGAFWLDESHLAFATTREKKDNTSRWYRMSIHGGEAEPYLDLPGRVGSLKSYRDGGYLYSETVPTEKDAPEEDFWVFDELPFWFNGKGVINGQRSVLKSCDAKGQKIESLTRPPFQLSDFAVSPSKERYAWCGSVLKDVEKHGSELYLSDRTESIKVGEETEIYNLCYIDEDHLFFTGQSYEWPGRSPRYYVYEYSAGVVRELPYQDASPSSTVGTDAAYGGGEKMTARDGWLYFLKTCWNHAQLCRMDLRGNLEVLCDRPGQISSFAVTQDRIYMTAMRDMHLAELYCLDLKDGGEAQLSHLNDAYHAEHELSRPEYFTFRNRAGIELEGFVLKPAGYEPGKKYPGVLEMHGGPKVVFGEAFHHEMQCLASQGYFVFYTNPRGSDGRGEDFANVTGKLGQIDYEDFMDFTDEVLRRYPDLDAERIGICGGSYGGFMCNWMIGHTHRFAAAASQRSISNYFTKSLCTDIGFNHNMAQLETDPWQDFQKVWANSPLKYAPEADTPTLFIQSDEDYRCWMSDAVQMYTALQMNGTPTRMVLFHGENHDLSRTGKPHSRIQRLTEIGGWFRKYLLER